MSVQTEIDRIISAVEAAHNKILEKGGTTERPYTVAGLEQAIGTIPNAVVQPLEVTENGTYTAPDGVDGYSPVTVNVAASGGVSAANAVIVLVYGDSVDLSTYEHMSVEVNGDIVTVSQDGYFDAKFILRSVGTIYYGMLQDGMEGVDYTVISQSLEQIVIQLGETISEKRPLAIYMNAMSN